MGASVSIEYINYKLTIACWKTNLSNVKRLIKHGADVNYKDNEGFTPIGIACIKHSHKIVKYLLKHGANPNYIYPDDTTPLTIACINGDIKIVKLLTRYRADVNFVDVNNTALSIAYRFKYMDIVKHLTEHGAVDNYNYDYNISNLRQQR